MPKENEVLDRRLQGCERFEQEPERGKSKTVRLLRGDRRSCRDAVTLRHVAQAGSRSGSDAFVKANNEEEIAEEEDSKNMKRTQSRKMNRKRARQEVKIDDQKEMLGIIISDTNVMSLPRNTPASCILPGNPRAKSVNSFFPIYDKIK